MIGSRLPRTRQFRGQYGFFASTGAAVVLVLGALLLGGSLNTATAVAFGHPDTPIEPLIYTQTSPDVPLLMAQITALRLETEEPLTVTVDTTSSFSWPWAWYLRDYPIVLYAGAETIAADIPSDGILIVTDSTLRDNPKIWAEFARAEPYRHRWWFPESGYRSLTPGALLSGIRDGSLLNDWRQFYVDRIEQSELGSIDGVVFFPRAATP